MYWILDQKSEHTVDKDITHIKSEPSILEGENHEGIKFDCKLCDYEANRKSNLSQHVKSIHEGIKYDCKLCDYKAKQRNSLTKHVESIHEGFKFECQL